MTRELEEQLINKYPQLYKGGRFYSFEHGDGWFKLIDDLSSKIVSSTPVRYIPKVSQVKEKFGSLRFYIDSYSGPDTDKIYEAINEAEIASENTCEECGEHGEIGNVSGYWVRCLCPKHLEEARAKRGYVPPIKEEEKVSRVDSSILENVKGVENANKNQ